MTYFINTPNVLASKIAAAALMRHIPSVVILDAQATPGGFVCLFESSQPLHEDLFPLLEQTMRGFVKKEEIYSYEMVKKSAVEFFNYHQRKQKADQLRKSPESLFKIIKVGEFVDLVDHEEFLHTPAAFKLFSVEAKIDQTTKKHYILFGICDLDEKSLKARIKKRKGSTLRFHMKKLAESGFLKTFIAQSKQQIVWLPDGVSLYHQIEAACKKVLTDNGLCQVFSDLPLADVFFLKESGLAQLDPGFFIQSSSNTSLASIENNLGLYSLNSNHGFEIYLTIKDKFYDLGYHLIEKIMNIGGVEIELNQSDFKNALQKEKLIRIYSEDLFDRKWELFKIELCSKQGQTMMRISLVSIERILALKVDLSKDALPSINFIHS